MKLIRTFFYSLKKSLIEPKYYQDIKKTNFWFSFKYLLFLFFILTLINSLFLGSKYLYNRPFIQPEVNKIYLEAKNLYPEELELKVRNGQLATNVQEPYVFNFDKTKPSKINQMNLLTIDTNGSIENYPEYNTYVLATKNAIVYPSKSRNNQIAQTSVTYFRDFKRDFTINKKNYDNLFNKISPYAQRAVFFVDWAVIIFLLLFLILGPILYTSSTLFGLIFLTFFAWLINLLFKKKYSYGQLFKMGIHASTWPILISEVVKYFKLPLKGFYTPLFLIWMVVIIFSQKNKK